MLRSSASHARFPVSHAGGNPAYWLNVIDIIALKYCRPRYAFMDIALWKLPILYIVRVSTVHTTARV